MYMPTQQNTVDQKIHNFMARKSPARTFSKTVAERLTPSLKVKQGSHTDIAYEPLEWHQTEGISHSMWLKAR